MSIKNNDNNPDRRKYLTLLGAWALAFGCSVGWGSFVMPGSTFLPIGGPMGTTLGIGIGGLVMIVLAANYHYLMNRYPDGGGTYTYTKKCFGYDHGFLSGWFLILTYVAIIWANATALPLIARTVFGSLFQFGFDYNIAGYHIYFGEILLADASLVVSAWICLNRKRSEFHQSIMALILFAGIMICAIAAMNQSTGVFDPAYVPESNKLGAVFTIFSLTPWAFVGFESISHSAHEAKFSLKDSFKVMVIAIITASLAYIFLSLLAASLYPERCGSWIEYIANLGEYGGLASQPTFFAADKALGTTGIAILSLASLCGIFTGLIGNYIALSRLSCSLCEDGLLPEWIGKTDDNFVPRNSILLIMAVSMVLPFLGRTAISWIVDVTTVGATIAYAFTSACAYKTARIQNDQKMVYTGFAGMVISLLFALEFLIPNLLSVKTLATESYLILALWSIVGFIYFDRNLRHDKERRLGRSIIAWVVLLGLIIFTSTVWMRQTIDSSMDSSVDTIQNELVTDIVNPDTMTTMRNELAKVSDSLEICSLIQIGLIVFSLMILFDIYTQIQRRESQIEVEKILAEESSKAKTSFLSNMSHEIRTPMNAIIGLDNIALRDPDITPRMRENLEKIGSSAKHLLGLINDILDMSRIESGRMVLKNEEFSFKEFLDQINIIINGQCLDKGLHYECNIVGDVSDYYFGDDMKLKQVLINILGNSVKFTNPPGDVTLTVEQLAQFEGFCTLRFIMKDTGIGMDKEYIPKIFEAFSQEDATTTNKYGGSGLGMAITKSFVEMMNGEIVVESEKGVGSTFTVTVTLKASSRSVQNEQNIKLPSDIRAMVIDDDEIACEHTQVVLRTLGIEADTATDAEKGLNMFKKAYEEGKAYKLLLTDYKMPDMNGLELVKSVRKFDNNDTAVIMLTGYNWDIIEDEAKADGVDGILAKPLFSEVLLREIYSVLAKRNGLEYVSDTVEEEDHFLESLEGKRVLMAEDVEQNAEILEDLLDLEGISAEHAQNGEIAVKMFADNPPGYYNGILMDVRMPVMDGLSATKAIRALDREDAKTIPIIAMTANVFDEDVERSLQAGMNAHLSKPIEPDTLYETLAKLLTK